jgi:hypothetical protein
MPSDTTFLRFVVMENSFGVHLWTPATPELFSLKDVSRWIKRTGVHLHACAFFTVEVLYNRYSRHALNLIRTCRSDFPGAFTLLLKKPVISLTQKLIENPEGDHGTETEELKFHIHELSPGTPNVNPGIYVEVSHGSTIDDNVAWWGKELPGTVFGCVSIEVYKEMLLPETLTFIDRHYVDGRPEDLETLVADDIKSLFQHITGR